MTDAPDSPNDRLIDLYPAGSYRQVWTLAYPAILTMISQTVMWTVDAAMVGHVGKAELAAVGLGGVAVWTLYSFFVGLTSVVNTYVSQAYGAGAMRRCGMYLCQGVYLALAASAVILVLRTAMPSILALMRPPREVQELAVVYTGIRMLSAPFFLVYTTYSHFFRGVGDTVTPLKILVFANAFNVAADWLLIFGVGPFPALGVAGAAWATSLANVIAAVVFVRVSLSRSIRERYATDRWRPRVAELRRYLRVGGPIAVNFFLDMGSFLVFSAYIGRMGTEPLAANQIAVQILALSFMPMQGLSIAATTLMGQYVGAGTPDLAQRAAYTTLRMGLAYAGLIAVLCLAVPGELVRIFNDDPTVVAIGRRLLWWCALFQVFDAVSFISDGALRGAGDTRVPMLIVIGGAWLLFLPLAWVFGSVLGGGVVGAWGGASLYIVVVGCLMFLRLRTGRWRQAHI